MNQLLLATRNKGKIKEIQALLSGASFTIVSVLDYPEISEVIEDGATLEANALLKARTVFNQTHIPTIADDSGLEVYALEMAPGVYSARYAGENVSYEDNNRKLLKELHHFPPEKRGARFRCVVAFVSEEGEHVFEGICEGTILQELRGTNGFGYDPLFVPNGYNLTFAELSLEIKNHISHRAKALNSLKKQLLTF